MAPVRCWLYKRSCSLICRPRLLWSGDLMTSILCSVPVLHGGSRRWPGVALGCPASSATSALHVVFEELGASLIFLAFKLFLDLRGAVEILFSFSLLRSGCFTRICFGISHLGEFSPSAWICVFFKLSWVTVLNLSSGLFLFSSSDTNRRDPCPPFQPLSLWPFYSCFFLLFLGALIRFSLAAAWLGAPWVAVFLDVVSCLPTTSLGSVSHFIFSRALFPLFCV